MPTNLMIFKEKRPSSGLRTFRKLDLELFFVHQDKGSYLDD
jgi:hypothetical protein